MLLLFVESRALVPNHVDTCHYLALTCLSLFHGKDDISNICMHQYFIFIPEQTAWFCCFFTYLTKRTRVLLSGRVVSVFPVENARLPQGEEGCGLLSEPGGPDAVLQVRMHLLCHFCSAVASLKVFSIMENNYTQKNFE